MEDWQTHLQADPTAWLLKSNPWTRYKTLTELLDRNEHQTDVKEARKKLINDKKVRELAEETKDWITIAPSRNSDPKITYYKLKALADFGLKQNDLNLSATVEMASKHIINSFFAARGIEPIRPKKGEKFEKPDLTEDVWHIAPCNAPVITYTFMELGVENDLVNGSIGALKDKWNSRKGWFCNYFFVESQHKKTGIGCPMAGLQALEIFSRIPELKESDHARYAFEPIKFHKDSGKSLYYFGRSKKFWTFKYPFVWYNALYLADVLTRFEFTKHEPVVIELIDWIKKNQNENGRFKATSIFMPYKSWDFGNKKEASPWITFLCCRILKQYYSNSSN